MNEVKQQSHPSEETKRGGQSVGGMGLVIIFCLSAHFFPEEAQSIKNSMSDAVVRVANKIDDAKSMYCKRVASAGIPILSCTNK